MATSAARAFQLRLRESYEPLALAAAALRMHPAWHDALELFDAMGIELFSDKVRGASWMGAWRCMGVAVRFRDAVLVSQV